MTELDDAGADIAELRSRLETLEGRRHSRNTLDAYRYDWAKFEAFCASHDLASLPADAETLALFAAWMTTQTVQTRWGEQRVSPNSITRAVAAVRATHRRKGYEAPDAYRASLVARAYRRERSDAGWSPLERDPILIGQLRQIVRSMDISRPIGVRDWAIVMLQFALFTRSSTIAKLDVTDLGMDPPHWLKVRIRSSKTDQAGMGRIVEVRRAKDLELCPVAAVLNWVSWLDLRGIRRGPLFRAMSRSGDTLKIDGRATHQEALTGRLTPDAVTQVVQRAGARAGIDGLVLGGHSLRRGGATASYDAGADPLYIAYHGGWNPKSDSMWRYLRAINARKNNPIAKVL